MKVLLDQDVYAATEQHLQKLGHDVVAAHALGMSQADDTDLLVKAAQEQRIFVSRDRDFGGLVFVAGKGGGVIYVRITPTTVSAVQFRQFASVPVGDANRAPVALEETDFGRPVLRRFKLRERDAAVCVPFVGELGAWLDIWQPDAMVIVNRQSLHAGKPLTRGTISTHKRKRGSASVSSATKRRVMIGAGPTVGRSAQRTGPAHWILLQMARSSLVLITGCQRPSSPLQSLAILGNRLSCHESAAECLALVDRGSSHRGVSASLRGDPFMPFAFDA